MIISQTNWPSSRRRSLLISKSKSGDFEMYFLNFINLYEMQVLIMQIEWALRSCKLEVISDQRSHFEEQGFRDLLP